MKLNRKGIAIGASIGAAASGTATALHVKKEKESLRKEYPELSDKEISKIVRKHAAESMALGTLGGAAIGSIDLKRKHKGDNWHTHKYVPGENLEKGYRQMRRGRFGKSDHGIDSGGLYALRAWSNTNNERSMIIQRFYAKSESQEQEVQEQPTKKSSRGSILAGTAMTAAGVGLATGAGRIAQKEANRKLGKLDSYVRGQKAQIADASGYNKASEEALKAGDLYDKFVSGRHLKKATKNMNEMNRSLDLKVANKRGRIEEGMSRNKKALILGGTALAVAGGAKLAGNAIKSHKAKKAQKLEEDNKKN